MTVAAPGSLFGTFLSYQERNADALFGRADDAARLDKLLIGASHLAVLTGPSGVGKTSLLRAGLTHVLTRRELTVVTLSSYRDLERELVRATSVVGIAPPVPGQDAADFLGGVARDARGGLVLILDNLEEVFAPGAGQPAGRGAAAVAEMALRVVQEAPRTRLVLAVDDDAYARLETITTALGGPSGKLGVPVTMTLPALTEATIADIIERSAVQSGTPFETGLAAAVAADLVRNGPCRPFDLQLAARAIVDLRLASLRRYRRSGGPAVLPALWLADVCGQAGGGLARRALLAAGQPDGVSEADLGVPTRRGRNRGAETLSALQSRGLLVAYMRGRKEVFALAHPALREIIEDFAITDRARATNARRALTRRIATGERLRVPELVAIHWHLRGTLTPPERAVVRRGMGGAAMRISLGVAVAMLVIAALYADSRRAYSLAFEPPDAAAAARVVVRLGRPRTAFLNFLPSSPHLGSVIADTGFAAGGLGRDTVARVAAGRVSGTLDATPPGHVPGWLREVLNGLRPVPRGIAKALLGDPDGVAALKLAFSDPASRGEILSALNVIGRGGAGEDEILAGALADVAPEIRRRGVAVAAAIARRQASETSGSRQAGRAKDAAARTGGSTHAATLRAALGDRSADVRAAVLQEAATLPPGDAAGIVTLALRDPDPALRRRAEEASEALAARDPAAVVAALADLLQGGDAGARRAALVLFESIAARAPAASAPVLGRVVLAERTPDDARVAALVILRRTGPPSPTLRPALEKAIRPESSPRLRAAALPLYARLVSPAEAEEIARNEMKGPPAARASAAAVWGAVAATRPEEAAKALKSMLFDPSMETRAEAARAYGYLKREGLDLVDKALKDPSPEVERAALESASALSAAYPYQVAEILGRSLTTVRPAVRHSLIETLARLGEGRTAVAWPPLARAVKDSDAATRVAAANGFCALAKKNAAASAPYLRIAAKDDRDDVRTAAAACLADVAAGDPKGASRIVAELAESPQPAVRAAAADALGTVSPEAAALALPTLLKLIADSDPQVRANAARAFAKGVGKLEGKRYVEAEKALEGALVQGDAAERKLIVAAAAKAGLWGLLRQAARDSDEAVRLEAVRAAGASKGPGLDVVRGAVDDRSKAVRAEAMRLLAGGAGGGARDALPTFEAMLHGADVSARTAAVAGIGELPDAGEAGVRLLGEALSQRSEALRAAAARALGRLAEREPARVAPYLERAVRDVSYDVRSAALPGLALAWSQRQDARELGRVLVGSDTDSIRRFVALEALVARAQRQSATPADRAAARAELDRIGDSGPALARLAARIGTSFIEAPPAEMHAFIERLFGG
jgi:HEAT repeat protein